MILHVFQNHVYQKIKINTYFTLQVILTYIKFALSSPKNGALYNGLQKIHMASITL